MSTRVLKERDFICDLSEGSFTGQYDLTNVALLGFFLAKVIHYDDIPVHDYEKEYADKGLEQTLFANLTGCLKSSSAWDGITKLDDYAGNCINLLEIAAITEINGKYDYPGFKTALSTIANLPIKQRLYLIHLFYADIADTIEEKGVEATFNPAFKLMNKLGTFLFKSWWNSCMNDGQNCFADFSELKKEIPAEFGFGTDSNILYYCSVFHRKFHKIACTHATGISENFRTYRGIYRSVKHTEDVIATIPEGKVMEQSLYMPNVHVLVSYGISVLGLLLSSEAKAKITSLEVFLQDYGILCMPDMSFVQSTVSTTLKVYTDDRYSLERLNVLVMSAYTRYVSLFMDKHHNMIMCNHRFLDSLCQMVDFWRMINAQKDKIGVLEDKIEKLMDKISTMNKAKKADKKREKEEQLGFADANVEYVSNKLFEEMTAQLESLEQELETYRKKEYKQLVEETKNEEDVRALELDRAEEQLAKIAEIKKHNILIVTGVHIPRITEELGIEQKVISKTTNISTVISTNLNKEMLGVYTKCIGHKATLRVRLVAESNKSEFFYLNSTNFNRIVDRLYDVCKSKT